MKIFVYYVGKMRDAHANHLAVDYMQRAGRYVRCAMREIQPERFDPWVKHPSATKLLLDPCGRSFDSEQFAKLVAKAEQESRDLVFLVGGASGLPTVWHDRGGILLSLSAMTYPHELARVMLAEQIYRALATLRGHPYPK
ncbi:MAG TPA: 23S rRNA (pseudouridine(1915)-N(3))-methyltransferase RlmH [Bryobacteraceae bacterium]|nr:23S rRNA (pseudouridine(1915)-N(3))-methyltransferase RlmH [Bryobacteraceae bacterium]